MPVANSSSLIIDYNRLRIALGEEAGYGRTYSSWDATTVSRVDDAIRSGLRLVYNPPAVPPMTAPHKWSWMRPWWQMQTAGDQRFYPLPSHFSRFSDNKLVFTGESDEYPHITLTTCTRLAAAFAKEDSTGYPVLAATRPVAGSGHEEQGWELELHPTPSGSWEIGAYIIARQDMISDDYPIPVGAGHVDELIKLACLAKLEEFLDNGDGQYYQKFLMQLQADVMEDVRHWGRDGGRLASSAPIGRMPRSVARRGFYVSPITYNGQTWESD